MASLAKAASLVFEHVHPAGLRLPPGFAFESWARLGRTLGGVARALPWALADWIIWGEDHYGEAAYQAINDVGLSAHTVANYVAVGRKFPQARRHPALSLAHHEAVASFAPAEQERWLTKAEQKGWTRSELRRALKNEPRQENHTHHICKICGFQWLFKGEVDTSKGGCDVDPV